MKHASPALSAGIFCLIGLPAFASPDAPAPIAGSQQEYIVIGWNDLGMHCMNDSFETMCVLPPYNTIWAQVIRRGNPPELISDGVTLTYRFPANTSSADKINFWNHVQALFGAAPPPDIGLTGLGLSGTMGWHDVAFKAEGVPITPFDDADPTHEQAYQLAELTLRRSSDDALLDQTLIVAPVSTELNCAKCHESLEEEDDWAGFTVYEKIVALHDHEEGTDLMSRRPVLCASCHASNALGTAGEPNVPNLSLAIHKKHEEASFGGQPIDCYDCHPGVHTRCHRDVMFQANTNCVDCHGTIRQVAESVGEHGRRPWLDEPRCAACHEQYAENPNTLYRNSVGHGGIYCAACHNSPHAILPTVQPRDGLQAERLQGEATYLRNCLICHTVQPEGAGPHGLRFTNAVVPAEWTHLR